MLISSCLIFSCHCGRERRRGKKRGGRRGKKRGGRRGKKRGGRREGKGVGGKYREQERCPSL